MQGVIWNIMRVNVIAAVFVAAVAAVSRIVYNCLLMTSVQQKNGGAFLFSTNFNGVLSVLKGGLQTLCMERREKRDGYWFWDVASY